MHQVSSSNRCTTIIFPIFLAILFSISFLQAQGNAVTFNGTSQYATLNTIAADMASNTTHSIEFWFKAPSQVDAGQVSLFSVNTSTGGNVLLILLGNSAYQSGKIYIYDGASASVIDSSNSTFLDDAPHHVAYVRNGATATLYVDGALEGSGTSTYAFSSTNLWSVGTEYDNGPTATDFFKGSVDDIRVWNAVRSIDTIQAHMFSLTATNANLKGWWKCDEASGTTLSDASGSTNTGTLVGSPVFAASFIPTEPTIAASNIVRSNPTTNSMTISWTRGNGDSCIVVAGNGQTGNPPVDGRTYTASAVWGNGSSAGPYSYSTNYVVYKGTGDSVTITNMTSSNQTYAIKVYEYKLFKSVENYLITSPTLWCQTLDPEPTVQASNVSFSSINTTSLTVNWTRGNGDSCIVLLKAGSAVNSNPVDGTPLAPFGLLSYYNANSIFQSGAQIGTGNYVVYNRTGTSVTVTGLTPGTTYYAAVYELNGRADWTNFKVPAATGNAQTLTGAPTIQATNVSFTSITSSSMTVQWTKGNGTNRLVVVKAGSTIPSSPVDGNTYTASTVFGSGNTIGVGVYVVYTGTGSSVNITGLTANTAYHVAVFEFNTVVGTTRYLLPPATGSDVALPVELVSFNAITKGRSVALEWKTATEKNNFGFEIERHAVGQMPQYGIPNNGTFLFDQSKGQAGMLVLRWENIGFVEGNGTTNSPKEYSFSDQNLQSGKYVYRLKQIDRDGKFEYSQEVEVMISQMPQMFTLMQNYPNPFNPSTMIMYSVPGTDKISLSVYDMLGREVASLVNGVVEAGEHSVLFNSSEVNASGIYFYAIRRNNVTITKRMTLIK